MSTLLFWISYVVPLFLYFFFSHFSRFFFCFYVTSSDWKIIIKLLLTIFSLFTYHCLYFLLYHWYLQPMLISLIGQPLSFLQEVAEKTILFTNIIYCLNPLNCRFLSIQRDRYILIIFSFIVSHVVMYFLVYSWIIRELLLWLYSLWVIHHRNRKICPSFRNFFLFSLFLPRLL